MLKRRRDHSALSLSEKRFNRKHTRIHILVEQVLSRMKKYQILAHEFTLKRPAHELRKLNQTLTSSAVDLNPHQIDASLVAFNCPLSRAAILCNEIEKELIAQASWRIE